MDRFGGILCANFPISANITLYNVCSVLFSTSGDTMSTLGGYHEYIGGCSVHRGDIMMHVGSKLAKTFQFLLKTPMY